jgi:hypothetical protein
MPAIDLDYLVGSAAIDIFVMLAISVGIAAEMRCDNPPYRRMAIKRWQSPGHQTLTICDRTREPSGSKLISSRLKLANVGDPPASSDLGPGAGRRTREGPPREGSALLQGLVVCAQCGERMTVRYHQRGGRLVPEYMCQARSIQRGRRGASRSRAPPLTMRSGSCLSTRLHR